jgi:agmatinase
MNALNDHLKPTLQPFMDQTTPYNEADYVIIGAPMDLTASYRGGTDKAPEAIRKESSYLESYSIRTGLDLDHVSICDLGDIRGGESYHEWIHSIETVVGQVSKDKKIPILIGGEHSITHGAIRALKPDLVVSFDAHMDLRNHLFNEKLSHATFMRRALETHNFKLNIVGCRALSREEINFTNENSDHISYIPAKMINQNDMISTVESIKDYIRESRSVYITVDMDVLDPVYAPAVGNPCPEGLDPTEVLDIINGIINSKLVGFDLNEVSPTFDTGLTSIHAAYIILETIYSRVHSMKQVSG